MAEPLLDRPYGPIVGADDVAAALTAHLQAWTPAYLAEVARQAGLAPSALPTFRSWDVMDDFRRLPEHQSPTCVVVPTTLADVEEDEDSAAGAWTVTVAVYVAAVDHRAAIRTLARYLKAARACLMQHRSLGGFAVDLRIAAESYDATAAVTDAGMPSGRSVAGGVLVVTVWVDHITELHGGPATPPADPTAAPPADRQVATPNVSVHPRGDAP